LEDVADRDEKLRASLNRKERVLDVVNKNRVRMEAALRSLDENLNKRDRNLSPSLHRNKKE
jgi:hypothetical protein